VLLLKRSVNVLIIRSKKPDKSRLLKHIKQINYDLLSVVYDYRKKKKEITLYLLSLRFYVTIDSLVHNEGVRVRKTSYIIGLSKGVCMYVGVLL